MTGHQLSVQILCPETGKNGKNGKGNGGKYF
jgi:hypothetical protein